MSVRVLIAHLLLASPFRGISPHLSGALYRKRRKAPAFRHGDISHTLFPRKDTIHGLY